MPMVRRCCCSRNLRTGSIVCGVWTLIWCVMSLALNISDLEKLYNDENDPITKLFNGNPEAPIALIWVNLTVAFLTFICSILVIGGIIRDSANMLLPWMIMVVVLVLLDATSIIFNIVLAGFRKLLIVLLLLWIITTLINIYCELCVLSHYQELKAGRGRYEDYMGRSGNVRYLPSVQHVHIGDTPINYLNSQHTVYSFHSQTLYDEEGRAAAPPTQNGQIPTALSNGRVFELRPVNSMPANMNTRYTGNSYTGSIEMKIVDSMPVIMDGNAMYNATNHPTENGNQQAAVPKRSRRFRTVSESAARQPMINETSGMGSINSLKKFAEESDAARSTADKKDKATLKSATFSLGANPTRDSEFSPLSDHKEEDEEES